MGMENFKIKTARRCKKCDRPLRSWNKTGLCSICYERDYKRNHRSQKKKKLKPLTSSSDIKKKIEYEINIGIDYANPVRVWKGIRKLLKLKENEKHENKRT